MAEVIAEINEIEVEQYLKETDGGFRRIKTQISEENSVLKSTLIMIEQILINLVSKTCNLLFLGGMVLCST